MSNIQRKDDVFTVLIHLGYLSFNWKNNECYIPNLEVAGELANAVEDTGWENVDKTIDEIRRKQYPAKIAEYSGDILLVGINYDKQSKTHSCRIERWNSSNS